jgi:uncharacterized protein (TIRG00374 family)
MFRQKNKRFWFRLFLSLVLVIFIATRVQSGQVIDLILSVKLPFFLLALFLVTVERVLLAYRWNVLLATKKMNIPFLKMVKIYYVSNFVGAFLPSTLGADILRAYSLYRYKVIPAESFSSVLVEKIIALSSSLALALGGVLSSSIIASRNILSTILVMIGVFIACLVIVLNGPLMQILIRSLNLINLRGLFDKAQQFHDAFAGYLSYKAVLFYVLLLSFLFQMIRICGAYSLSRSLNQEVGIIYFFVFVPIIVVLTMLPISVAGIGIREGAFVYFFSKAGMSTSEAFTLAILIYVLVIISIIPGYVIYLMEGLLIKREEFQP